MTEERDSDDTPFEAGLLREIAEAIEPGGAAPRDAMWVEIERRVAVRSAPSRTVQPRTSEHPTRGVWRWGLAASFVLAAGVAIGRLSAPGTSPPPQSGSVPSEGSGAVRTVAVEHLIESEALLSLVGLDAGQGMVGDDLTSWGARLLGETRLLLDVTPREDVQLRALLEDLEVILSQLALLDGEWSDARRLEEVGLLADGLRTAQVLPRIQTSLPMLESTSEAEASTSSTPD